MKPEWSREQRRTNRCNNFSCRHVRRILQYASFRCYVSRNIFTRIDFWWGAGISFQSYFTLFINWLYKKFLSAQGVEDNIFLTENAAAMSGIVESIFSAVCGASSAEALMNAYLFSQQKRSSSNNFLGQCRNLRYSHGSSSHYYLVRKYQPSQKPKLLVNFLTTLAVFPIGRLLDK